MSVWVWPRAALPSIANDMEMLRGDISSLSPAWSHAANNLKANAFDARANSDAFRRSSLSIEGCFRAHSCMDPAFRVYGSDSLWPQPKMAKQNRRNAAEGRCM